MAQYAVTLCSRTGVPYGPLELAGNGTPFAFSSSLNNPESGELSINLTSQLISGRANRRRLTAWGSEVVIERLAQPGTYGKTGVIAAGPVQEPTADYDGGSLSVTFAGVFQWLMTERLIDRTVTYGAWEQTKMAADLIKKFTTGFYGRAGDIRLTARTVPTGVLLSQQYTLASQKQAGQAIVDIAAAANGFDFTVELSGSAGNLQRMWVPVFPQRGRTVDQILTPGRGGLRKFNLHESADIATRIVGIGQTQPKVQASAAIEDFYGVHSKSFSLTDSNSAAKLRQQAVDYLAVRTPPVNIVTFSYRPGPATPYGFIENGDTVRVQAGRGWLDYDGPCRVIGQTLTVDPSGAETVDCIGADLTDGG